MRDLCAFTSRDMGETAVDAFTYAVVLGWGPDDDDTDDLDARPDIAERFGWDPALMAFLDDAHQRFAALTTTTTEDRP